MKVVDHGNGSVGIELAAGRMPPPQRAFSANRAHARVFAGELELIFEQRVAGLERTLAAVVVAIAAEQGFKLVTSGDFLTKIRAYEEQKGRRIPEEDFSASFEMGCPNESMLYERASLVAMAHSLEDGEVRFYRVRPTVLMGSAGLTGQDREVLIDPVITVFLPTRELHRLVELVSRAASPEA